MIPNQRPIRAMALRDLFKPKWKHSDPAVRQAALETLTPDRVDTFTEIASADPEPSLRLAAAGRIDDRDALQGLLQATVDAALRALLVKKLDQHYRGDVLHGSELSARLQAVAAIQSEAVLADVATEVTDPELRSAIVDRITEEPLLVQVAEAACGKELGAAIVARVTDEALLARLAENGANKTIRRHAADKIAAIEEERNRPSREAVQRQELEAAAARASELADSYNWDYVREQLRELRPRIETLTAALGDSERRERFEADCTRFEARYQEFLVQERERQERACARAAAIAVREALCEQVEAAAESPSDESEADVAAAAEGWEALEPFTADVAEQLAERFENARAAYRQARADELERRKQHQHALAAAEQRCAKAETLAGSEDWDFAAKAIAALAKENADAAETQPDVVPAGERIAAAAALLQQRREAAIAATEEEKQARIDRLTALCECVEAARDNDDHRAARDAVKQARKEFAAAPEAPAKVQEELAARFRKACDAFFQHDREAQEARDWEHWANLGILEELVAEAEKLAEQTDDLYAVAKQVRALQKRWKGTGPAPGSKSHAMWERFRTACDTAYTRCREFFAKVEAERQQNLAAKIALCERVEAVAQSDEWEKTAATIRTVQTEWKAIGPIPKAENEPLWARFRAACDCFFNRRRAHYQELHRVREEHLAAKQALAEQAEAISDSDDWRATGNALKALQRKWKDLGPAPTRKQDQEVWERFHGACNHFFERLENRRPENLAKKQALCEQVEALVGDTDTDPERKTDDIARRLIELQKQWREIGPVPHEQEEAIWTRFHAPCDRFFTGRREACERNAELKQDLVASAEELQDSSDWGDAVPTFKNLQAQWKQIGPAPGERERELYGAFRKACNHFFGRLKEHHHDEEENLRKKEELCARIESLAGVEHDSGNGKQGLSLADQLQIAFESNFITNASDDQNSWRSAMQEVRQIQDTWREIGPVPRRAAADLNQRYRHACDAFYEQRPDQRPRVSPEEMARNRDRKLTLCEEAEACAAADDPATRFGAVRGLQKRWKETGRIQSKEEADQLWDRFRTACDVVYQAHRAGQAQEAHTA